MESAEQLSLSWDAHQKSICSGLSLLQQRGEFVDMTLAADGHHVKVHQMVLSLVSPYIKDLISTAQCPHPVIFLNNISYTTLCAMLEYIYTGEVLVDKNKLSDLIAAGKALHIRGLKEMDDEQPTDPAAVPVTTSPLKTNIYERLKEIKEKKTAAIKQESIIPKPICKVYLNETKDLNDDSAMNIRDVSMEVTENTCHSDYETCNANDNDNESAEEAVSRKILAKQKVQYSLSNQGGLLAICNRYIYHLRYCSKKDRRKSWRCNDYNTIKCPANLYTDENNVVVQRTFKHNHPFHDKTILKKVRLGKIFSVFQEAEVLAADQKKQRQINTEKLFKLSETTD